MAKHNDFGRHSEIMACEYLVKEGYEILATNWRSGHKEIDIIARQDDTVVIVEVKARKMDSIAEPEEAINYKKITNLVRAADTYMNMTNLDLDVRFDIITLLLAPTGEYTLNHIADAFYPPLGA
ncbi:MAG: YraN family protein [bacterium]